MTYPFWCIQVVGSVYLDVGRRGSTAASSHDDRARMAEKRILLVEDEGELREVLAIGLRRAGYPVDATATAAEARQLIQAQSYALVIADWQLPDGNGIDLADDALNRRSRTLIISGYLFGLPAGAAQRHAVLTKPITVYDLVAAVQHRIGNPTA